SDGLLGVFHVFGSTAACGRPVPRSRDAASGLTASSSNRTTRCRPGPSPAECRGKPLQPLIDAGRRNRSIADDKPGVSRAVMVEATEIVYGDPRRVSATDDSIHIY